MLSQTELQVELALANASHLYFTETFAAGRSELTVAGIDILKAFSYDLIQVLNHRYLEDRLSVSEPETKKGGLV